MSAQGHAPTGDSTAEHNHFDGTPADRPSPDEPRTPLWLPLVGIALFLLALFVYVATRPDGKSGAEFAKEAAPAASAVEAAPAPRAPRPPRPTELAAAGNERARPAGAPAVASGPAARLKMVPTPRLAGSAPVGSPRGADAGAAPRLRAPAPPAAP